MTPRRIDAHHHLWRYDPAEFGWIDGTMDGLKQDFLPADLAPLLQASDVAGTVAVQALQTVEETRWLLSQVVRSPWICGVVGWLPIADPGLEAHLEALAGEPRLKGLRHVVQAEPAGFLDDARFNAGIRQLTRRGLSYDILIFAQQLEEALRFVRRHPQQGFVLDHIGKPAIGTDGFAPWAAHMRQFAALPNVACKLSGMVTETGATPWSAGLLQPCFDVVLETFGPDRLMAGTDWPVLTLRCAYAEWWRTVESWIAPLSAPERADILGGTAARFYGLGTGDG